MARDVLEQIGQADEITSLSLEPRRACEPRERHPIVACDLGYEAEGRAMVARLALPAGEGPVPGVLIAHGASGSDEYCRGRPEALAQLGYAALAIDYHGGGRVYRIRPN